VKGNQTEFLQKFQIQACFKFRLSIMPVHFGILVKYSRTFLKKHNDVDLFDISVGESLSRGSPESGILTQKQVCRITGNTFARKGIALFLNLNIDQRAFL